MAATKGSSRDRLLDAAEQVFAEKGYDAATTREIAALSGDTLGTLSYHFKNKETLLREVIARRIEELNERRRAAYAEATAKAGGTAPDLDQVVTAIVLPLVKLAMTGGSSWENYITLLCKIMYVAPDDHQKMLASVLDPVGSEFLGWLKAAVSPSRHRNASYAYQFIIGCTLDAVIQFKNDRLKRISAGSASARDFADLSEQLLLFLVAGTHAILDRPAKKRRAPSKGEAALT